AFLLPLANLSDDERTRFAVGNSFFRRNWVEAPSSTQARDGLGPHFIARSCGGCHVQGGRGAPPDFHKGLTEQPVALLMRLSVPGTGLHGDVMPEPTYGGQFNNSAVQGVKPEGRVTIRHQIIRGQFTDGTSYTLQQPLYRLEALAYGPMAKNVMMSPRIAQQMPGVGLLDAISEADILGNARDQAALDGPVKGLANRVWDVFAGEMRVGRFGWKANVATLAHQTAGAFNGDIGITSTHFPDESCTASQKDCLSAPRGAQGHGPEIDDATLGNVVFWQSALAPAARREPNAPQVLQGQKLFAQAQCAACHRPSYTTAEGPFPALTSRSVAGQRIWPYTDLLLHKMGTALADHRPDFLADGQQWKTPPLWGVGLIRDVNGHQQLMHDGRARGTLEAVLWHGGEAESSRQKVLRMNRSERDALVKFVDSL
ncbi:MAG: hypothetical protein RIS34_600, partial [Pseudomonadota bacterium]